MTLQANSLKTRKSPPRGVGSALTLLEAQALAVFGDARAVAEFFATPHPRLDGKSPRETLAGSGGRKKIAHLLASIAHGLPA